MQPFRRDRRGNVAMMTGLLAVPLLGLIGLGIDFSTATTAKSQLDAAADAAALVATTNASNAYLAGAADPITPAQAAAAQRFLAQAGIQAGITIASSSVVVQQAGTLFTANVTYQASVKTVLAGLFGVSTVALAGASTASLSINPYVDIQVLMDVSSSMTIAATQTDINQMQALTAAYTPTGTLPSNVSKGEACAFACHWTTTGDDYFALANRNGVQLRINVLRSAVGNLITNVAAQNTQAAFRLGLYTFSQKFNQIYPLSGQIGAAANALSQISPDVNDCSSNCPDTYFQRSHGRPGIRHRQLRQRRQPGAVAEVPVHRDRRSGGPVQPGPHYPTGATGRLRRGQGQGHHHPDPVHALPAAADQRVLQPIRGAAAVQDRPGAAGLRHRANAILPGRQRHRHRRATAPDAGQRAANVRPPHPIGHAYQWAAGALPAGVAASTA